MKTQLLTTLLFLLLLFQSSVAQITLVASDFPQADQVYGRTSAATTDINPSETGEEFSWDYSSLQSLDTQNEDFVSVEGAPFSYQFLFNNPATPDYLATAAQATDLQIELDVVTIENPYAFYKADEDAYEQVGLGATINGFPLASTFNPIDVIYDLPLEYGDSGESESNILFAVPLLGLWQGHQIRSYEVDGYGSLTTPYNTYDCIRTKTTLNGEDSLYIDLLQIGQTIPRVETIVYSWLAKEEGVPVLEITTQLGAVTQVRYKDAPENVSMLEQSNALHYANGTLTWGSAHPSLISVFDINGKEIMSSAPIGQHIMLQSLSSGIYVVKGRFEHSEAVLKLFVKE